MIDQQQYLKAMESFADGERMVPEFYVGGVENVWSHFVNWNSVRGVLQCGMSTVEVGCGCGMSSRIYANHTRAPLLAIDRPEVVLWSEMLYPTPGVTYLGVDLNGPLPQLGVFDAVICIDVIEHIAESNYEVFLCWLAKLAKPNGAFIFRVPVKDKSDNFYHVRGWEEYEDFLDDVGRFIPKDRIRFP